MDKNVLSDHPNWIITSFVNGAFGHLLGRCLATSPDVKWYGFHYNGDNPWNWNHFPPNLSFGISPGHFIPWFDSERRIHGFGRYQKWNKTAVTEMYNEPWLLEILDKQKIVYQSHDNPDYLRARFPNAKIILIDIDDNDWLAIIKNHIEKSGSYTAILDNGQDIDPELKAWASSTGKLLSRDWEQYSMGLTTEEWIAWHVNDIKQDMAQKRLSADCADVVFHSSNRLNAEAIVDTHIKLGIEHNRDHIQKVLDSFNLNSLIGKYLKN
jgi:hypothetical protein